MINFIVLYGCVKAIILPALYYIRRSENTLEIHQLQYVLEVAKHRHFTHAAESICVGQSSLSHQIAKLEGELGVKLFERTTRMVYPTPAGEEFIQCARRILSEIESTKQCMDAHSGVLRGMLNVGAITTLTNIDFGSIMASFHQLHPDLNLDIVQAGSYRLLELLRSREIEIALLTLPSLDDCKDMDLVHLADDEYVLVMADKHRFASRKKINLSEAANENFVFHKKNQSMYYICLQACRLAGFEPKIVCQSSGSSINFALISAGMGIGFFPMEDVRTTRCKGIVSVKLAEPFKKQIVLVMPTNAYHAPPVLAFHQYVTQWFSQNNGIGFNK